LFISLLTQSGNFWLHPPSYSTSQKSLYTYHARAEDCILGLEVAHLSRNMLDRWKLTFAFGINDFL